MAHLEFCLQCLWPELDAQVVSVTEQWAQVAVAGPRSRELIEPGAGGADRQRRLPVHGLRRGPGRRGGGAALPHLLLRRAGLRGGGAGALRRGALARASSSRRAALGGGALRARGAERAQDREGPPHPRRARTAAPRRTTSGSGGCWRPARTASARPAPRGRGWRGRGASSSSGSGRSAPDGRLLAGAHVVEAGAAFTAANDLGYLTSRLPLADPRPRHRARLRRERAGADRRDGCGRSAGCAGSTPPARSCAPVFVDPDGAAAPWLSSSPSGPFDGARPAALGGRARRSSALPEVARVAIAPVRRAARGGRRGACGADRLPPAGRARRCPGARSSGPGWAVARRRARAARSRTGSAGSPPSPTRATPGPGSRLAGADARRRCWRGWCRWTSRPGAFPPGSAARSLLRHVPLLLIARDRRRLRAPGAAVLRRAPPSRTSPGDAARWPAGRRSAPERPSDDPPEVGLLQPRPGVDVGGRDRRDRRRRSARSSAVATPIASRRCDDAPCRSSASTAARVASSSAR